MDARHGSRVLFVVLAALFVLRAGVILVCDVVTQDGPNHVATAHVLHAYPDADAGGETDASADAYRRYFTLPTSVEPTLLPALALAGLMSFFDPIAAEKAFVLGYWALFFFASLLVLRSLGRSGLWFVPFLLPYAFGFPFHMGFYGYQLGVALFLAAWGLFLGASPERFGHRRAALFGLCALGVVLSHPLPLVPLLAFLGLAFVQRLLAGGGWRWFVAPSLSLVPAVLFLCRYLFASARLPRSDMAPRTRASFFLHDVLGSHDLELSWMGASWQALLLVGVALALALASRQVASPLRRPLLLFAAFFALAVAWVPDEVFRGRLIATRLQMYCAFGCVGFLGTFRLPAWGRGLALAVGASGFVGFAWSDAAWYRRVAPYREEYLSASREVSSGATLLALPLTLVTLDENGSRLSDRVRPFVHLSAIAAAERGLVDLTNLQAAVEYNAVRYRETLDPYRHLALDKELENVPPRVDIAGYHARTDGSVDYVLLWQPDQARFEAQKKQALFEQLGEYDLVHVSRPRGMAQLYRKSTTPR